jgi:hypothetical protein
LGFAETMPTPLSVDQRSPKRRTVDEKITAEPPIRAPNLPSNLASSPVEVDLSQQTRPESGAMFPTTQSEAMAILTELCDLSPDVRLAQLIAHLGFLGEDQTGRSLWEIDDEQFLTVLNHHKAELLARKSAAEERPTAPEARIERLLQAALI